MLPSPSTVELGDWEHLQSDTTAADEATAEPDSPLSALDQRSDVDEEFDEDGVEDEAAAGSADPTSRTSPSSLHHHPLFLSSPHPASPTRRCLSGCLRSALAVVRPSNLALSFQSIGIIYGDIGTSSLYTFTAIFSPANTDPELSLDARNAADVIGVMSLLFWALTVVVSLKYVCIVMMADDRGEGGSFALLGLIRRHYRQKTSSPPPPADAEDSGLPEAAIGTTHLTASTDSDGGGESGSGHGGGGADVHGWLLRDPLRPLTLLSFFGACLLISDGVLTPAISVLSAVEGVSVANPSLSGLVVPLSLLILALLFIAQRFGTGGVARFFSPIMLLWFLTLLSLGLYNLATSPPALTLSILSSLSPHLAASFLYRHGVQSISHMAAVVLCVTGVEVQPHPSHIG